MELKKINVKEISYFIGSMGLGVVLGLSICKIISTLWNNYWIIMSTRFEGKVILLTGASSCNPDKQMGFAGETVWRFFKEGGAGAIITDVQDELGEISNK